jgi:hypothetical protein
VGWPFYLNQVETQARLEPDGDQHEDGDRPGVTKSQKGWLPTIHQEQNWEAMYCVTDGTGVETTARASAVKLVDGDQLLAAERTERKGENGEALTNLHGVGGEDWGRL